MVHVASVSAIFFPLLGLQPILGRQFLAEEENPDSGNVVLLSEGLWRDRFGADPANINQTIQLGERTFTVVGVMPARVKLFDPSSVQFNRCFKGFIAQNCQMVKDKRHGRPG